MPLKLEHGVTGTVAGHRLGALEGGVGLDEKTFSGGGVRMGQRAPFSDPPSQAGGSLGRPAPPPK